MEDLINELMGRYGKERNYSILTDAQKEFLMMPPICDNKVNGFYSAEIRSFRRASNLPKLYLTDTFYYMFMKNRPHLPSYIRERLSVIQDSSGLEATLDKSGRIALFVLRDLSEVKIKFQSVMDKDG